MLGIGTKFMVIGPIVKTIYGLDMANKKQNQIKKMHKLMDWNEWWWILIILYYE